MSHPGFPDSWGPVPVVITASDPTRARVHDLPMFVEFAPGLRFRLQSGPNTLWLPPGRFRAEFWLQYAFWTVGAATLDIDSTRGAVQVFYAAPRTLWHRGCAGYRPVQRTGGRFLVAMYTTLVCLLLLGIIVALLGL